MKKLKYLTMIKLKDTSPEYKKIFGPSPYIFLGEIPNMYGHCVICSYQTGKIYCGYHTDNFIEIEEDEL